MPRTLVGISYEIITAIRLAEEACDWPELHCLGSRLQFMRLLVGNEWRLVQTTT